MTTNHDTGGAGVMPLGDLLGSLPPGEEVIVEAIVPADDTVEHDRYSDACVCGPRAELVDDGARIMVRHQALSADGGPWDVYRARVVPMGGTDGR